jgi:carboxylate-amine ligase
MRATSETLSIDRAREVFESSTDFTVGIEEEFALLDPESLSLVAAYERLQEEAQRDEVLAGSVCGELISSEIEIRSGKGADFADALQRQQDCRDRLFELAAREGVVDELGDERGQQQDAADDRHPLPEGHRGAYFRRR